MSDSPAANVEGVGGDVWDGWRLPADPMAHADWASWMASWMVAAPSYHYVIIDNEMSEVAPRGHTADLYLMDEAVILHTPDASATPPAALPGPWP